MVEIATAGTTIRMEFMKYGLQAGRLDADLRLDQALSQGSIVQSCGRAIMPPAVISRAASAN
jgi:hypothetical protein